MADEETNPLVEIRNRADEMQLEGEERDDYILGRMQRAGFKKGPGEWIRPEDDEEPKDDDDEPVTRGEWRRINRERQKQSMSAPPKKTTNDDTDTKDKGSKKGKQSKDPWW